MAGRMGGRVNLQPRSVLLTGNQTLDLSMCRLVLQPVSHTSQPVIIFLLRYSLAGSNYEEFLLTMCLVFFLTGSLSPSCKPFIVVVLLFAYIVVFYFAVPGCNLQEADSQIWGKYSKGTHGIHSSAGDEGSRVRQRERLGCAVLTTKLIPL